MTDPLRWFALVLCLWGAFSTSLCAQKKVAPVVSLKRNYHQGETLRYEMKASNRGWEYQIQADGIVKTDANGAFFEEIGWSNLRSNAPMTLSLASLAFRQQLSLSSSSYLKVPDLSKVQPYLIGPITDLLTFYSDLGLANRLELTRVGQHAYFRYGKPSSWADGQRVVLGEDSIDFDLSLVEADAAQGTAVMLVRHVPPVPSEIKLTADWMKVPVADTENNWVEVEKKGNRYLAEVGKETFDVRITVETKDGSIRSAELHNPVVFQSRECEDAELLKCGAAKSETLVREVRMRATK
jgi:hypothetical protein